MKRGLGVLITVGMIVFACATKDNSKSADEISGVYGLEYSFKVVNPESGHEVGMRTVRDTIFIRSLTEGFEVSNHRWASNGYDHEGWRSMEHSDNRPFQTFFGEYDSKSTSLITNGAPTIYIDLIEHIIWTDNKKTRTYLKIN